MPVTYSDVMTEVAKIKQDSSLCNAACRALGVNVPADSSLVDLGDYIRQIDSSGSHPDYELPWIMSKGDSGFILDITSGKNRGYAVEADIVPALDDTGFLLGCSNTNSMQDGLNQMTAGMRARLRMNTSTGGADTNNYAGLNSQWSDSAYPYYHKCIFVQSYNGSSQWRASLYSCGSWTHAGSSLAQQSTSIIPTSPIGVFARYHSSPTGRTFPYSPIMPGVKVYGINVYAGAYDSSSLSTSHVPCLHWDSSYGKYRPCFKRDSFSYSSYPLDAWRDLGTGEAYYIDYSLGLEELDLSNYSGGSALYTTDIQADSSDNLIIMYSYSSDNKDGKISDYIEQQSSTFVLGRDIIQGDLTIYNSLGFNGGKAVTITSLSGSGKVLLRVPLSLSSTQSERLYCVNPADNTLLSMSNYSKNGVTGSFSRGVYRLSVNNGAGVNQVMIFDDNSNLKHCLNFCKLTVKGVISYVYYDCVTKTIYTAQ